MINISQRQHKKKTIMTPYLNLLRHISKNGHVKEDRTGTGTISTFDTRMSRPQRGFSFKDNEESAS